MAGQTQAPVRRACDVVIIGGAIMGPHTNVSNFLFLKGFSGRGLQQSPAMGRGTAEWLTYGAYRALDLTPFNFARIPAAAPLIEKVVI